MKCYQPEVYFASETKGKNKKMLMKVITLRLTRGAASPVTIVGFNCNALIDTSAARSCISKTFYNEHMLPQLLKNFCLVVTSASGSTLCPMDNVQCPFKLGGYSFEFNFIVHLNLTRPIILGLDFMSKY